VNDDDLTERLADTLRAKAAQIDDTGGAARAPDTVPYAAVARHDRRHGAWRSVLVAAAAIGAIAGVTAAVLAARADDSSPRPAAPPITAGSTTSVAPATTLAPTTTVPNIIGVTSPLPLPGWTRPAAHPDGTLVIGNFNELFREAYPVEADPVAVAATFLQIDTGAEGVSVHGMSNPDGGPTMLTITETLADDSVAEVRSQLTVGPSGVAWQITRAGWSQRCQPNRGHQDFNTELCV
jgi:hypothetical protein